MTADMVPAGRFRRAGTSGHCRSTDRCSRLGTAEAAIAAMDWPALDAAVAGCTACGLCHTRTNTVFGVGDRQAEWMLIGESTWA
ncbi:hypothetical protein ACTMU2_41185 [Cupriavidus basilensis]